MIDHAQNGQKQTCVFVKIRQKEKKKKILCKKEGINGLLENLQ